MISQIWNQLARWTSRKARTFVISIAWEHCYVRETYTAKRGNRIEVCYAALNVFVTEVVLKSVHKPDRWINTAWFQCLVGRNRRLARKEFSCGEHCSLVGIFKIYKNRNFPKCGKLLFSVVLDKKWNNWKRLTAGLRSDSGPSVLKLKYISFRNKTMLRQWRSHLDRRRSEKRRWRSRSQRWFKVSTQMIVSENWEFAIKTQRRTPMTQNMMTNFVSLSFSSEKINWPWSFVSWRYSDRVFNLYSKRFWDILIDTHPLRQKWLFFDYRSFLFEWTVQLQNPAGILGRWVLQWRCGRLYIICCVSELR